MSKPSFQGIRGMSDILPQQSPYWSYLEEQLLSTATSYGYQQIRLPIVEQTELFKRTIGAYTDIVEKEMYTFNDRNDESLTLRPEGTAGCVRACIQHGMLYNQIQRLWYLGPMFRYERPQKGRYRQFYQFGIEAFGMQGPDIEAEQILMMARLWKQLAIADQLRLELNTLGNQESRAAYREALVTYFSKYKDQLDEDSARRLQHNPLRILDSKIESMQPLIKEAPVITDYLNDESKAHFDRLRHILDECNIPYVLNPRLVRGLDYYGLTIYEWVTDRLGAQGAVCAGGRYNRLVEQLGGKAAPAVGFSLGVERVVSLLETVYTPDHEPHAYLILVGEQAEIAGMRLAEELRTQHPEIRFLVNCGGGSFKSQFKRADKSGAKLALILGDDELQSNQISVKYLRMDEEQQTISHDQLQQALMKALTE